MIDPAQLLRLQTWLSPSFPIGAFSYSGGLEAAVDTGAVEDRESLKAWLSADIAYGMIGLDAAYCASAHRVAGDEAALSEVMCLSAAQRTTAEQALETSRQGDAFCATAAAAWPHPWVARLPELAARAATTLSLPVVIGVTAAAHGLPAIATVTATLHSAVANLLSAALRLMSLGQTTAQQLLAELEPLILTQAETALRQSLPVPLSLPRAEVLSLVHETQYSRLFRS